jgi:hypothetical protein
MSNADSRQVITDELDRLKIPYVIANGKKHGKVIIQIGTRTHHFHFSRRPARDWHVPYNIRSQLRHIVRRLQGAT